MSVLKDRLELSVTDGHVAGRTDGRLDGWTRNEIYDPSEDVSRSDKSGYIIESVKWRWLGRDREGETAANIEMGEGGRHVTEAEILKNDKNKKGSRESAD